jgi:cephalosporin hydroxylase
MELPHAVEARLSETVREYWLDRVRQHTDDSYLGIPLSKFPEDLRVYEHLLWESRAQVVVEIGVQHGASALWFRDRLRTLHGYGRIPSYRVVGVDVDLAAARANLARMDPAWADSIGLVEGDVLDPELPARVSASVPPGTPCLVVEPGGYFVVEDGCVDIEELRPAPDWPRGVIPAIEDWLQTAAGGEFRVRRDLELYGISCHPHGFLQRLDRPARM